MKTIFYTGLTKAEEEMFTILMEECGEIVQAASKIKRHGLTSRHPRLPEINNMEHLQKECGDFMCMMDMLERQYPGFKALVQLEKDAKIDKMRRQTPSCLHYVEPL